MFYYFLFLEQTSRVKKKFNAGEEREWEEGKWVEKNAVHRGGG